MRGLPPALTVDWTESYQPHAPHGGHGDDDSTLEMHMTHAEIREVFDSNLNLTLAELSRMTGLSIPQLKKILMDR